MDMPRKAMTIQDVARYANVSAATVSRVLSAPERVAEHTRERVIEAIQETGYTMNLAARSLRLKAAQTILVAAPKIGNPFYSTIVDAVIQEAQGRGYGVLVSSGIGDDPTRWMGDHLLSNRADGLLLFDRALDTRQLHDLNEGGRPLPLVAAYDEVPDPKVNSVITDNRQAAVRAMRHLHALGHRKIGHVSAPSRHGTTSERKLGYLDGMRVLGLEVRADWIFDGDYTMPSGVAAADYLMSLDSMPTAVFCGNDDMAIGLMHRLRAAGILCPRDISIMGFDDIDIGAMLDPSLTTMHQPREQIGRRATQALIDIIEGTGTGTDPTHIVLSSQLVERNSTAAIG